MDILIIEDNAMYLDALARQLEQHGYSVTITTDSLQGLYLAEKIQPHLVVLDLNMPMIDSAITVQHLRHHAALSRTPIIGLVTQTLSGEYHSIASGCDDIEVKPINIPRLLKKVAYLIHNDGHSAYVGSS